MKLNKRHFIFIAMFVLVITIVHITKGDGTSKDEHKNEVSTNYMENTSYAGGNEEEGSNWGYVDKYNKTSMAYINQTSIYGGSIYSVAVTNASAPDEYSYLGTVINVTNGSASTLSWEVLDGLYYEWYATITDGTNSSLTNTTSFLVASNTAPIVNLSNITSTESGFYDTSTLLGWCNATDIENDNITYYYSWYENDIFNISGVTNISYLESVLVNVANISSTSLFIGRNWTLECMANDGTLNSTAVNSSTITIIDVINPNLDIMLTNNSIVSSLMYIIGTAYDFHPDSLYCNNTDWTWNGTYSNWAFENNTAIADGIYHIYIATNDTSGNINSTVFSFTYDTTSPSLNLTLNDTLLESGHDMLCINASATDLTTVTTDLNITYPNGSIEMAFGGAGNPFGSCLFTYSSPLGIWNVTWYVIDAAGNSNLTYVEFNVTDTIIPTLTITSANNTVNNTLPAIIGTASDTNPDSIFINDTNWAWNGIFTNWNFTNSSSMSSGVYHIEVYANDTSGNNISSLFVFTYVTAPPQISFNSSTPINNSYSNLTNISAFWNVSGYVIDNITATLYNGTLSVINMTTSATNYTTIIWQNLSAGVYYYNISVKDLVLNFNYTETRKITLDFTAPIVMNISPANNTDFIVPTVDLYYNITEAVGIDNCSLYYRGVLKATNTSSLNSIGNSFTIVEGTRGNNYEWYVVCYDLAHNIGRSTTIGFNMLVYTLSPTSGGGGAPSPHLIEYNKNNDVFSATNYILNYNGINYYVYTSVIDIALKKATVNIGGIIYRFPNSSSILVDLNRDRINDVEIKMTNIASNKVVLYPIIYNETLEEEIETETSYCSGKIWVKNGMKYECEYACNAATGCYKKEVGEEVTNPHDCKYKISELGICVDKSSINYSIIPDYFDLYVISNGTNAGITSQKITISNFESDTIHFDSVGSNLINVSELMINGNSHKDYYLFFNLTDKEGEKYIIVKVWNDDIESLRAITYNINSVVCKENGVIAMSADECCSKQKNINDVCISSKEKGNEILFIVFEAVIILIIVLMIAIISKRNGRGE